MEICYWCCHLLDNSSVFTCTNSSLPEVVKADKVSTDIQPFPAFPRCVSSPTLPGKSILCLDSVCKQQDKCHLWDPKETWKSRHEAPALPSSLRQLYTKANSKPVFLYNQSRRRHSSREFWIGASIISNAVWPGESSKATFPQNCPPSSHSLTCFFSLKLSKTLFIADGIPYTMSTDHY